MNKQALSRFVGMVARRPYCAICESSDDLTIDHIIPRSHGGLNGWDNLQLLCHPCNQHKAKIEQLAQRDFRKVPGYERWPWKPPQEFP